VQHLLDWILWLPMIGFLILMVIPKSNLTLLKWTSLLTTFVVFLFTLLLYSNFDNSVAGLQTQFLVKIPWIKQFNINYYLGVDGISLPMVILTSLLFFICILCSWNISHSLKAYFALLLMLETTVFGVFLSLDFFLFYVFWEIMLLPMFFLIGIWGGENKEYAAIKFFLYTFFGSIVMLLGIIGVYFITGKGAQSFDIIALQGGLFTDKTLSIFGETYSFSKLAFWAFFLGFAIKVPIFPFHTWLPHAHVQAPTAVSVILAGVLLKMGTYGFLRISFPLFPDAAVHFSEFITVLGLINVIYGALCAMAQDDLKRLVAYSSVSHMGFVMMGLGAMTSAGMNGAVLQMFNHGTSTAMMFLMVGILYERSHHRWIVKPDGTRGFSGLGVHLPKYTVIFIIAMFASLGLPGLSGFISEVLIFMGVFPKYTTYASIGVIGLLLGAAYLLWMFKRMFFGEPSEEVKEYDDMNVREVFYMMPLCIAVIVFGVYPSPLLNMMKESVNQLVTLLGKF
jgi:NADH-quinone oxidoreductase subunit M